MAKKSIYKTLDKQVQLSNEKSILNNELVNGILQGTHKSFEDRSIMNMSKTVTCKLFSLLPISS